MHNDVIAMTLYGTRHLTFTCHLLGITPHFTTRDLPSFLTQDWGTGAQLQSESSLADVFAPQGTSQRPVSSESQPLSITSLDIAAADATQGARRFY